MKLLGLGSPLLPPPPQMTDIKLAGKHTIMYLYVCVPLIPPICHAFHTFSLAQNCVTYFDFISGCG